MTDLNWIRIEVVSRRGLKYYQLADLAGIPRQKFTSILNGFQTTPVDFENKVRDALAQFDNKIHAQSLSQEKSFGG